MSVWEEKKKPKKTGIVSNWKERQRNRRVDSNFWAELLREVSSPGQPSPLAGSTAVLYRSSAAAGAELLPALLRPRGWGCRPRPRPDRGRLAAGSGTGAAAAPRDSAAGIISRSNEPRWASSEGQPQGPTAAERKGSEGRREREGRSPQGSTYLTVSASALSKSSIFTPCHLGKRKKERKKALLPTTHQQVK